MMEKFLILLLSIICALLPTTTGQCQIQGTDPVIPVRRDVLDIQSGEIFREDTTNVNSIQNSQHSGDALNGGPYYKAVMDGSQFVLSLSEAFADYEELEYTTTMSIFVTFSCAGSTPTASVLFNVHIEDTNNNSPRFIPESYSFSILPPIVHGYELTGCYGNIVARDIDLTTQSIIFSIEDNPYFEIEYGGRDPSDSKNFFAILRATSVIRSLPEPLTLQISAQDVDLTPDPPRTTYTTITIEADANFEFPEEPIFSQPFYTATYSDDHTFTHQDISLAQGYDSNVEFTLSGVQSGYFRVSQDENVVSIYVDDELPADVLQSNEHILLVVRAEREHTSGDTATIVVQLPDAFRLEFEQVSYSGVITDNVMELQPLGFVEPGTGVITTNIVSGDYDEYFTAQVIGATVTLTMNPLPQLIIEQNNFISIVVEATSGASTTSAVVVFDIIKYDTTTPVFSEDFYVGSYDPVDGVQISNMHLSQGYDENVQFVIDGDGSEYFDVQAIGNSASLILETPIPQDVISSQHQFMFPIRATKPRTVGASAIISIVFPAAFKLEFEQVSYSGVITDNVMELQPLGFVEPGTGIITANIVSGGDYDEYFTAQVIGATVTLTMNPLPQLIIEQNNFISIVVEATSGASTTSAVVVFDIIKYDTTTPVFSEDFYVGSYDPVDGVQISNMHLSQGYDENVQFVIDGDGSEYFDVQAIGNSASLILETPIPQDVISSQHQFMFPIRATKPRTVGASAIISIVFPAARMLRFEEDDYRGSIQGEELRSPPITLVEGFQEDVTFSLSGEFAHLFGWENTNNVVTLSLDSPLTQEEVEANDIIVIILEATGINAISSKTAIVLNVDKDDTNTPVFSERIYNGIYFESHEVVVDTAISLNQGYDETVNLFLEGDYSSYFDLVSTGNSHDLVVTAPLPTNVMEEQSHIVISIVASKFNTIGAHATLLLSLPQARDLDFEDYFYEGTLEGESISLQTIILHEGYRDDVLFSLEGDLATFFDAINTENEVTIELVRELPADLLETNRNVLLVLRASGNGARVASTVVVLDIIQAEVTTPVFDKYVYTAQYNEAQITVENINLIQGFDDTVTFRLEGDFSHHLNIDVDSSDNSIVLEVTTPLPADIINSNTMLVLTVVADKPGTLGANAALNVEIPREPLQFFQTFYTGSIEDGMLQLEDIVLSEGYNEEVIFHLSGEYEDHFRASNVGNIITIHVRIPLTQEILNANNFIILELHASGRQTISDKTTIILDIVKEPATVVSPIFSHSFYPGTYSELTGLKLDVEITLSQGFDDLVTFALTGENSQYFEVQSEGNSVTLLNPTPIPSNVLAENHHLSFTIIANKPGTLEARAAIFISLTDDMSTAPVLRFEQISYSGNLDGNNMQIDQIIQIAPTTYEGELMVSIVGGDYSSHFTVSNVGYIVTIGLDIQIPDQALNENTFLVLELEVYGQGAISGQTTVVLEIIKDPTTVIYPIFSQSFYPGTYSALTGLELNVEITLSQGFDDLVTFALTGENSQYFEVQSEGNSVTLLNPTPIPSNVLAENHHLSFTIIANKPGTLEARAAIFISLTDDMSTAPVLRFEQISYSGNLDGNNMQIDQIIQIAPTTYEGELMVSIVGGDYSSHFTVSNVGYIVTIGLDIQIPDQALNENTFLVLELEVYGQGAISGQTTVVLEIIKDPTTVIYPIFSQSFYPGTYSALTGLELNVEITLSQGFDDLVTFALTGENSQYFEVQSEGNSVTLLNPTPIPSNVLAENHHLSFTIIANKPGTLEARAAIFISLTDDMSTAPVLRFEQISYSGNLDGNNMQIDQIIQIAPTTYEGELMVSIVGGDYSSHFTVSNVGYIVTIGLDIQIPDQALNENTFLVLELEVYGQGAISGQTTVVLEIIKDPTTVIYPIFSQSFYPGTYSALTGLELNVEITLSQGFDDLVTFALTGENSQYFEVQSEGNSVTLLNPTPIPSNVLAENHHLSFTIIANKPGTVEARAAIFISLTDDMSTAPVLRFEQISYSGNLDGNNMQIDQIIQIAPTTYEGELMVSIVGGDYSSHFTVSNVGYIVTIGLDIQIPDQALNENTFLVLELEVYGQGAISGQTTVVLEIIKDPTTVIYPIFSQSFYPGTYSALTGLELNVEITLSQGFDDLVTFALTGENSQYFEVQSEGNSVTLLNPTPIPSNVLAENHHLSFTIIANKPGTLEARAAIFISLTDDMSTAPVLRFEQISYSGNLDGNNMQIDQIIQIAPTTYEGELMVSIVGGDYSSHFTVSNVGYIVTIGLDIQIPDQALNENTFLVLELEVYGQGAISGQTTVVLEIIKDPTTVIYPIFSQSFYPGTYSALTGLELNVEITLSQGFDDLVTFALTGENSQYFEVQSEGNSVTLLNPTPIPSNVLAENHHLSFTIIANKPGTLEARAAIFISLTDDMSTAPVLRFEQISYSGNLDGNNMQIDQIIQIAPTTYEGELMVSIVGGDYSSHFTVSNVGYIVTIGLDIQIPDQALNENTFLVLELEVYGQGAISGQTTVVLEIIKDPTTVIYPIFSQSFYPGTYSALTGLELNVEITLSQGFDDLVTFALTGENSQYFEVQSEGNSVTLLNPTPIPSNVLAENHHLSFTIIANKPGTLEARAAIFISLTDDMSTAPVLRFEQISYSGNLDGNNMQIDQIIQIAPTTYEGELMVSIVGGDYSSHFTVSNVGYIVTIGLDIQIPDQALNENTFLVLELEVYGQGAISGQTTVVLEIIKDPTTVIYPIFSQSFYPGTYSALTGLELNVEITLSQGFDDLVTFALTGENSQYFEVQSEGNSVTLLNPTPIPSNVLAENHHLSFTIIANKPGTLEARAAIFISLTDDMSTAPVLRFEQISYSGNLDGNNMQIDQIIQIAPTTYEGQLMVSIVGGDYSSHFTVSNVGYIVTIGLDIQIPDQALNENTFLVLELEVYGQGAISGQTTVVLEILKDPTTVIYPIFSQSFYPGTYSALTGLELDVEITLSQGFDDLVTFALTGENSQYFEVESEGNSVTLLNPTPIPSNVLAENHQLSFTIIANKPGTLEARAAIFISLTDDMSTAPVLRFEQISYSGNLDGNNMQIDQIIQIAPTTYEGELMVSIVGGDYSSHFTVSNVGYIVTIGLDIQIPDQALNENTFLVLELEVYGQGAISGQTTVVLEIIKDPTTVIYPIFSQSFYPGTYSALTGLELNVEITLSQGFDDLVTFALTGENSQYFEVQSEGNSVTLLNPTPIPSNVLAENHHLSFTIIANKPGTLEARAAIFISLTDDMSTAPVLRFEQISYSGNLDGNNMQIDQIIQIAPTTYEGELMVSIVGGDYSSHFTVSNVGYIVTIGLDIQIPDQALNENTFLVLELEVYGQGAISGQTTVVLEIIKDPTTVIYPIFSQSFYPGTYSALTGLELDVEITLSQGFDDLVTFALTGENSQYFEVESEGNSVTLLNPTPIPSNVLAENHHLSFTIIANKPGTLEARAAIFISLTDGPEGSVFFESALYTGSFEQGVTSHETIFVYGYTEPEIHISGGYSSEFVGAVSEDGQVEVRAVEGASFPAHVAHLSLLLQADSARTALVLTVIHPTSPDPPSVAFEFASYVLRTDVSHSGLLARVTATATNGETTLYSLVLDNSHLEERLSVSSDGELWLSAPADSGIYQFSVRATTIATQVSAEATVHLTVDSVVVCGADNRVLQPLIVLERDEEEPHDNLIILNEDFAADCSYEFTYRWPTDRDWIYINEQGHVSARIIDREDPAIAFMVLSQIQIELVLTCSNDDSISRKKRDVLTQNRTLEPYDYGQSEWILTEGIGYNARRSFVNLIVNDINDNPPIFIGEEDQPIVVGYPVESLLEVVNPSPLITVQATDADIGLNAELVYWSSAPELAVSSRTGAVYVRDNAAGYLQSGTVFTISASDLAGAPGGHTGHIDIMVRLLELDNIIVLSIRNALLDNEREIIELLSEGLQYDVKSLGATVISDQYDVEEELGVSSRLSSKRFYDSTFNETLNVNFTKRLERLAEVDESGATLRIFIYGLLNSELVEAAQLKSDIEHSQILEELTTFQVQHLQEHLDNIIRVIGSPSSNTGLLVSTIVLACLLFIVIMAIGGWFFFRWWKARRYTQFRDSTSVSNEILETTPKVEDALRPRPNIEEIKRTERRLQQMLEQPVVAPPPVVPLVEIDTKNGTMEMPASKSVTFETVSEGPTQPEKQHPIVIQSIDKLKTDDDTEDEDEFGEKLSSRRKSVVTFNEQVEKIITVDNIDPDDDADVIVQRL